MNEKQELRFWVCQRDDGKFLAASTETPRFCFSGDTEDAVIAKASRAFDAYFGDEFRPVVKQPKQKAETQKVITQFRPLRFVNYSRKEAIAV